MSRKTLLVINHGMLSVGVFWHNGNFASYIVHIDRHHQSYGAPAMAVFIPKSIILSTFA